MGDGGRTMLTDSKAERAVIAAVLLDNATLTSTRAIVETSDFDSPRHALTWAAFLALAERGDPIDVVTVAGEIAAQGKTNAVDNQFLGELTDDLISPAHCEAHARIVADLAARRRHVEAARMVAAYALEHGGEELSAYAAKVMREAAPRTRGALLTGDDLAGSLGDRYRERLAERLAAPQEDKQVAGTPSGLATLDEPLCLGDGRLYIFAARPAMGKSALVGQIAHHVASLGRGEVVFFAEEMPAVEVAHRDVAGRAGVDVREAERAGLTKEGVGAYFAQLNELAGRRIVYDDTPHVTVEHIEAVCQRRALTGRVALVVVDYLQLLSLPKAERHDIAIGAVTRRLKALARSLNCPVICVSQLNRECESRPDKRPLLADLRSSGDIEQDGDGVVFVYRDEVYKPASKDKGFAEILIAKQRNGPTGMVKLRWRAEQVRFADPDDDAPDYAVAGFEMGRPGR